MIEYSKFKFNKKNYDFFLFLDSFTEHLFT